MFTNNDLTLNVFKFSHARERLTVHVSTQAGNGFAELPLNDLKQPALSCLGAEKLYFSTTPNAFTTEVDLAASPASCSEGEYSWSVAFLKKYYSRRLADHFAALGMPVHHNFVSDTDVWVKATSPYTVCTGYRVFTLRVQFNRTDRQPELLISVGDVRSVYNKSLADNVFAEVSEELFNWVIFRNAIYRYSEMPELARRHLDEVFPCVSFSLLRELRMQRPAPDKGNRYIKYQQELVRFKNDFLDGGRLNDIMRLDVDWKRVKPCRLDMKDMKLLQFGEGEGTEPKYALKEYGPKELITDETVFFFVMHQDDRPLAFTINEYLAGKRSEFKGGVSGYLRMKYRTEPNLSIVFTDKNNPLPEIEKKLDERVFSSQKKYIAIYLSPHDKWTQHTGHKSIYYRIKEALLLKSIVSQTIDVDKVWGKERKTEMEGQYPKAVLKSRFDYSLPNILVAIHAKLGATPWCFASQPTDELVIGISAYKSHDMDRRYLGSAFSFTNEGRFQGFDCFRSNQIAELAGSIALAVKNHCAERTQLQRLVIHFYKRLSGKELKPVEAALAGMGLKIPVVVVSVNKSFSDDIVGFDLTKDHKMPLSGMYTAVGPNQYLLFNNQLQQGDEKLNDREGYPFPLKITLQQFMPGSRESSEIRNEEVEMLLTQVCRFSQLYWKSVSRQWMPVTLRYPEMLAQIVPHFKYKDLSDTGRENLWFL